MFSVGLFALGVVTVGGDFKYNMLTLVIICER